MIFSNLSEKLQNSLNKLMGRGKLSEKDVDNTMREIKLSLLEADVNYKVVRDFVNKVKERCVGSEVMNSLTPGQMVIKIVNEELTTIMGKENEKLNLVGSLPHVIMLCGLQGAGKTTHAGKIALKLKKEGKNPLLVACDIYRPAAISQLEVIGKSIGIEVFSKGKQDPTIISYDAYKYAQKNGYDTVIIDTAGRLQIDENLMEELENIKNKINPVEILLVIDSMTGQEAVNVASAFDNKLNITGLILTKLDGDARGGAALSIKQVVGKPIKLIGTGEKLTDLETFYPDRLASRILGMGDVLSLIEKAEKNFSKSQAKDLEEKLRNQTFGLDDFMNQVNQIRKMGPIEELLSMIPGLNTKALKGINIDDSAFIKIEALISSMTKQERNNPDIIGKSRKERITSGSGVSLIELNKLLKQFKELKKMMKKFGKFNKIPKKKFGNMNMPFFK